MYPVWAWVAFGLTIAVLLAVDLTFHRGEHAESHRAAVVWSVVWIGAALLFNVFIWVAFGARPAQEYLAAWAIEKSLSLDNLFVFLVVFQSLRIEPQFQHKVLFWGIFGALVFRALFIFLGVAAVERYRWVTWLFGAILLFAALRAMKGESLAPGESRVVRWLSRFLPVTHELHAHEFITEKNGRKMATPLLLALIAVETTDILFAIDSVPAAFAVTYDRFILYSSNAFAILGLRALYVVLAKTIAHMRYLHYGLAAVLAFAALKLMLGERLHLHPLVSVGIIVAMVGASVVASLWADRHEEQGPPSVPREAH